MDRGDRVVHSGTGPADAEDALWASRLIQNLVDSPISRPQAHRTAASRERTQREIRTTEFPDGVWCSGGAAAVTLRLATKPWLFTGEGRAGAPLYAFVRARLPVDSTVSYAARVKRPSSWERQWGP
ncbi:hypothetical protein EYF80_009008 [Liparis tanakae]|uniref:Uncharacterized protein n=1 Tax=Liparis tanakae TaxID=230148 RepID=A0A4Z2ITD3_9TELE|nr:hypothetical protein EYF80_009008 [Liparis tanakae]